MGGIAYFVWKQLNGSPQAPVAPRGFTGFWPGKRKRRDRDTYTETETVTETRTGTGYTETGYTKPGTRTGRSRTKSGFSMYKSGMTTTGFDSCDGEQSLITGICRKRNELNL